MPIAVMIEHTTVSSVFIFIMIYFTLSLSKI